MAPNTPSMQNYDSDIQLQHWNKPVGFCQTFYVTMVIVVMPMNFQSLSVTQIAFEKETKKK